MASQDTTPVTHTKILPTPAASPTPAYITPGHLLIPPPAATDKSPKRRHPLATLALVYKLIKDLDGRDKSIKIIQYFFKILIHHQLVNPKRWSTMVSNFSQTRKILRLGVGLGPLHELLSTPSSVFESVVLLNELGNSVADDVYCLFKMGLVSPETGHRAELVAYYCWFAAILHDIWTNAKTLEDEKLDDQKRFMTHVTITKLTMDGIFCACDIWQPSFQPGVQAWSGFFSGVLSGYKLWKKMAA